MVDRIRDASGAIKFVNTPEDMSIKTLYRRINKLESELEKNKDIQSKMIQVIHRLGETIRNLEMVIDATSGVLVKDSKDGEIN